MARKESVRVAVVFEPGKGLRIIWFYRQRQQHRVMETTYRWQDRIGDRPLMHFAVTDGEGLYVLTYSPLDSTWTITDQQAVA